MISIPVFQVDAFADRVFTGNPAAVCPLDFWLADDVMQQIAAENNLSETAFFVYEEKPRPRPPPRLRWFTPLVEAEFCGHATLAAAHVIFTKLDIGRKEVSFMTRRGFLTVRRGAQGWYEMDFPQEKYKPAQSPAGLAEALGRAPAEIYAGSNMMAVYENQQEIESLAPDMAKLSALCRRENTALIATALGEDADFVSRFFAPAHGVDEDPATGSAHCMLTPFWVKRLAKPKLTARQISPRGAVILCAMKDDRVILHGRCADYMRGEINIML